MADSTETAMYAVNVCFRDLPHIKQPVMWGPFADFGLAQRCVVELASRDDVLQAFVNDAREPSVSRDWADFTSKTKGKSNG